MMLKKYISMLIKRKWNRERWRIDTDKKEKGREIPKSVSKVTVTAIQRELKLVKTIEEFSDKMEEFVLAAAEKNSDLIAFPEYNMLDMFGLLPGFHTINKRLQAKQTDISSDLFEREYLYLLLQQGKGKKVNVSLMDKLSTQMIRSLFLAIAEPSREILITVMQYLAAKYNMYIYTGSYLMIEEGKLYNAGSIIDRNGEIVGTQKKLHLTDFEDTLHMSRGTDLQVFSLDFAKVAIPICMDGSYYETFYMARNLGADIVVLPIANNEEYDVHKAMRGIWSRIQETPLLGVKPALNGWLGDIHFTGKAGVFLPEEWNRADHLVDVRSESSTILGACILSQDPEGDDVITVEVNMDEMWRKELREKDRNLLFEEKLLQKYNESLDLN